MVDAFLKLFLLRETDSNKITESCMPVYCVFPRSWIMWFW